MEFASWYMAVKDASRGRGTHWVQGSPWALILGVDAGFTPRAALPAHPAGEVSQSVGAKLLQLCQALDVGDFVTATHLQASSSPSAVHSLPPASRPELLAGPPPRCTLLPALPE